MASVQKGMAVVWSIGTPSAPMSASSSDNNLGAGIIQSATFTRKATESKIQGTDGATKTVVYSNTIEEISLEIIPTGDGASITNARAAFKLPGIGMDLTIVDASDPETPGTSGTVYIINDVSKTKSVEGAAKMSVKAFRYTAGQLATVT